MEQTKPSQSLPDNAYRELKPGEEYVPMMPADAKPKEVTPYSVTMGLLMAVLFSAAAAYLGLRIGQVFEAAIPIAIIAVGVGNMLGKKNMLGQNVIIQSIGASSGIIVAGAIFTLPALYILGLETAFYKVFLSSVLGGILGIVLLIPFRKYFVKEMHGKYPFPEATATTEVLVSGEKGGNQAKLLAVAGLVGGLYDFAASTFGLWTEEISTRMTAWGTLCADKFKTLLKVNTSAAVLGLGYIIGLKYSAIIAAGSFLIWLLVVPVVGSTATGAGMSPEELYQTFGRPLGIGGIAMAGLIGIIRQSGIIKQAMGLAVSEFSGKKKAETNVPRTQRDLTMRTILTTLIAALATTFFFFQFGILGNWGQTAVALLIVFVISFLFTTVAANAIAIVGSNPVSGMTLMTLILASLVLVSIGLNGTAGMTAALIIGGVVCTALSTAGGFITDLKIGYWIGTTPKKQESWKFLGVFVSAATVAGVMIILNKTYGFGPGSPLEAPQANAMAAVIQPLMQGGTAPWVLYFCGAVLALVLTGIGIPALPFALGMFLPLQLNLPLLIGGLIAWFVSTRSKDQALNKARMSQGTLIASGFIGIIRQSGIIKQAMGLAVSEFSGKKKAETNVPRTQRDLTMRTILTTLIAALATTFFFFQFGILGNWGQTAVALLIVFVISFLFTTVAANAIAIVGSNPVSGMTLMTLILASLVLVSIGLNGTAGMTAALIIGGVVCTALSTAGGFITDLKIGYWIGTTPKKQESWKFLGVFVSAATVAGVMIILNKTYGFGPGSPLEAPQANAMAAVIQPLMQGGTAPWVLYFCGAVLALVLTGIGIPALPFALGMFLPLQLNLPLLIGGLIAWFVSTRSKDQALNKARMSQGTLIASGFIAGGALMGVVGAILKFADVDWKLTQWNSSNAASWVGLGMYLALIIYFAVHSLRAKKEE